MSLVLFCKSSRSESAFYFILEFPVPSPLYLHQKWLLKKRKKNKKKGRGKKD